MFELRTYYAAPGKLDALLARFRDHTCGLFKKHGMVDIAYWVPLENPENKLIYILRHASEEARIASWTAFGNDPQWHAALGESEKSGSLTLKVESILMDATDFSALR